MSVGLTAAPPPRDGFPPTRFEQAGLHVATGAYVTAAVALNETVMTAHGDGTLRAFAGDGAPREIAAHRGAVLAMAADGEDAVLTGGDDGRCLRVASDGGVEELGGFGSGWVDCVAAHAGAGMRACSVGKIVHVWESGGRVRTFEHPSTVGGLAFDARGRRLAVAHYGGVTIWERGDRRWRSSKLAWAGSHIGVSWSPDGKYVVSVMQENALHGWRLRDKADMRMSGYPGKPRSVDWVGDTPYLASSGADQAVCWPFDGKDGPMGRGAVCVAYGGKQLATSILGVPGDSAVLVGFRDGAVLISDIAEDAETRVVRGSTGVEVTALAMTPSLSHVLIGDAEGEILWARLRD